VTRDKLRLLPSQENVAHPTKRPLNPGPRLEIPAAVVPVGLDRKPVEFGLICRPDKTLV
jgi:hypothetical protein